MPSRPELIANYSLPDGRESAVAPRWSGDSTGPIFPPGGCFATILRRNTHEQFYQGRPVGGLHHPAGWFAAVCSWTGARCLPARGHDNYQSMEEIPREREFRFNDVIADPRGRVFCGIVDDNGQKGRLYRLDPDGSLSVVAGEHRLLEWHGVHRGSEALLLH